MIVRGLLSLIVLALLPTAAVAAEKGVTDTEIVVGCSNSFSGPLAFTGEQMTKMGIDLYFRVVNDAGGIGGRKIRTVYYDDGFKPQDAVANTRKLVEQDGVFAVIATQGTAPSLAALATATTVLAAAACFTSSDSSYDVPQSAYSSSNVGTWDGSWARVTSAMARRRRPDRTIPS